MKEFFKLLASIVFVIVVTSCGGLKKSAQSVVTNSNLADTTMSSAESRELRTYLDGSRAEMLGDVPLAINLYTECLRMNPKNDAAMYRLAKIYIDKQKYDAALTFTKSAVKLQPNNEWYKAANAEAMAFSGQFKESAKEYEALAQLQKDNSEYYYSAAYMYLKAGKPDEALRMFNQLEKQNGEITEDVSLQKQQIYVRLGKIDLAAAEIQKLIDQNPNDIRYYGMLAELYEANNMNEKAMAAYDQMTKVAPNDPRTYIALSQFYLKKNDWDNYYSYLSKIISSTELMADVKLGVLSQLMERADGDSTKRPTLISLTNRLVEMHPNSARAQAFRGDVMAMNKDQQSALTAYQLSIKLDANQFPVWQQIMIIQSDSRMWDSLISSSAKAIDLFPNQALSYFLNGSAEVQLKRYDKGVKVLKRGLPITGDNNLLKSQFYSSLGDAYNSLTKFSASDSAYDKALSLNPDDVYVLNNYAYYLSLRNTNLEKAAEMSRKSNLLSPNNSSFLDTYGWILFQQGKYSDAKDWIVRAINNGGSKSETILEHLGDVYYKLGNVDDAVKFWQQAKDNGSKNTNISKKIAERKLPD